MWVFFLPSLSINDLAQLPDKAGIYYVTAGWRIFYVGRAQNLRQRWQRHHRYPQFRLLSPFGRLHYRLVKPNCLDRQEKLDIQRLKPHWNYEPIPEFWGLLAFWIGVWLWVIAYTGVSMAIAYTIYVLHFAT